TRQPPGRLTQYDRYLSGTFYWSGRVTVINPHVNPCWPSAEIPPRSGVHSTRAVALSGLAPSASMTLTLPSANCAAVCGITPSSPNIADRLAVTSPLAPAAENARSVPSSSSSAADGEG